MRNPMAKVLPLRRAPAARLHTVRTPTGVKLNFRRMTDDQLNNTIGLAADGVKAQQDYLHALLAEKAHRSLGVDRSTQATLF